MIKIIDLRKRYKSKKGPDHQALNGINLELGSKGFVVLLGKSGSGKSTLLNILGGLDKFDSGEIIIKGKSTKDFKNNEWDSYRNTYVGFIFQEFYIIEEFTVGKNISLALELQGYTKEEIPKRVEEILASVELAGYKDRKPNEISGGQKQRIAIARALVKDPKILLADEPTGNLDSETGKVILETLQNLAKEKLVIMVTHDVDFANQYGDRIIELKDGVVISDTINEKKAVHNDIVTTEGPLNTVVKLEAGKQLTQKVINYLNNVLGSSKSDIYLGVSEDKEYIKTIAPQIDEEVKTELVSYDYLKYNENDKDFNLKKSSLNFMSAFKLAVSSIFTKKIRLFFMMILFIAALVFVGMATNFSNYDSSKAAKLTFEKAGVTELLLSKKVEQCESWGCYYTSESVSSEDIALLRSRYQNISFSEVRKISYELLKYDDNDGKPVVDLDNDVYYRNISNIQNMVIFEKTSDIKYDFLIGNNITNKNDILITDFIADVMIHNQFYGVIDSNEDLIGKTLSLDNLDFKIAGIIDTDYEKYDYLKDSTDFYLIYESGLMDEVAYNYSKVITTNENISELKKNVNSIYKDVHVMKDINSDNDYSMIDGFYYLSLIKSSEFDDENKLIGSSRLPQNNNEIVIYFEMALSILNDESGTAYEKLLQGDEDTLNAILNSTIYLKVNEYGSENEVKEYTIVGVYNNLEDIDESGAFSDGTLIIPDEEFMNMLNKSNNNRYGESQVLAKLGNNDKENGKFFSELDELQFNHNSRFSNMLYTLDSITTELKVVFYWMAGVFAAFATIMIFTFISSSITAKKKEIGTLRAIGARGIDVSKIFIIEGMIITLVAAFISTILMSYIIRLINNLITDNFNIDLVLLYTDLLSILAVLGLGIFVTLLASFIPVKRITVMKPIDAIKNK